MIYDLYHKPKGRAAHHLVTTKSPRTGEGEGWQPPTPEWATQVLKDHNAFQYLHEGSQVIVVERVSDVDDDDYGPCWVYPVQMPTEIRLLPENGDAS